MSIQYQESTRNLQQFKNQISRGINEIERLQGEERSKKIRETEDNLSKFKELIQSINNELDMMDPVEKNKMSKNLQDYQADAQKFEDQFKSAINRGELIGSPKNNFYGGSNSDRQHLLDNRNAIDEGNQNLYRLNDMGNEIIGIGHDINNELHQQGEKENDINRKLIETSIHASIADKMVDRMAYRQKKKVLILWIVIILVIIIFLSVFLYYVFRP